MAELDKKIQKTQTDLVQAVLEALEKKNQERVDMLITNAIKQLKMSRFKPDQTTYLSLTYLARISPKLFQQSSAIKEVLKSLLRRDNGPANIKGKNDIVLPVLAANILLACCDAAEIRTIVLNKIEQWLSLSWSANQKAAETVQHLLATLCMKCPGDQQTISALIEMRQHWLQYLDENFDSYGPVPIDLCADIRRLLHSETSCDSIIVYLKFLIKHDCDINGLSVEVSKFILERPISLGMMLKSQDSGIQLITMILQIYIKLFKFIKNSPEAQAHEPMDCTETMPDEEPITGSTLKEEKKAVFMEQAEVKSDSKPTVSVDAKPQLQEVEYKPNIGDIKNEKKTPASKTSPPVKEDEETSASNEVRMIPSVYIKLPDTLQVVMLSRPIVEAILSLMASIEVGEDFQDEFSELLGYLKATDQDDEDSEANIYEDPGLTTVYNLPGSIRQRLVHSTSEGLVNLGLRGANTGQLIAMLQQFGTPVETINKILRRLMAIKDTEQIRSKIADFSYFNQLIEFYSGIGISKASELTRRLEQTIN